MDDHKNINHENQGTVVSVRGSLVDAHFPGQIPSLNNLLITGEDRSIMVEVISHPSPETIRGIALTPTQGLAINSVIMNTGNPLRVPVGRRLLGRVFNVFGETIDNKK